MRCCYTRKRVILIMKHLVSFVGDSDPIRNYHDGSLLHIVRHYRPERTDIIHSEHTLSKHDKIVAAIAAIPNYKPTIHQVDQVVSNDEVHLYTEMFEFFKDYLTKLELSPEDQLLLNIASGTPQVKSGIFAVKHMLDINASLIQVTTPVVGSNAGKEHNLTDDIETLIELNEDQNNPDAPNRCLEVEGRAFRSQLLSMKVEYLLEQFDYYAVERFLITELNIPNRSKILNHVHEINHNLSTQTVPKDFLKKADSETRKVLHYYLIVKMALDKGNASIALIQLKSLAEFLLYEYIEKVYPGLIETTNNNKQLINSDVLKKYNIKTNEPLNDANLYSYHKILQSKEHGQTAHHFAKDLIQINSTRNTIAHSLDAIDEEAIKGLKTQLTACKRFIDDQYEYNKQALTYYEDQNEKILQLLAEVPQDN